MGVPGLAFSSSVFAGEYDQFVDKWHMVYAGHMVYTLFRTHG